MTTDPIFCPDCGTWPTRSGVVNGHRLEVIERNASGCAADMMNCPECGHVFAVTYQIKEIIRNEDWEDKEQIAELAKAKEEKTAKAILRRLLFGTPEEVKQAKARAAKLFESKTKESTDG